MFAAVLGAVTVRQVAAAQDGAVLVEGLVSPGSATGRNEKRAARNRSANGFMGRVKTVEDELGSEGEHLALRDGRNTGDRAGERQGGGDNRITAVVKEWPGMP